MVYLGYNDIKLSLDPGGDDLAWRDGSPIGMQLDRIIKAGRRR